MSKTAVITGATSGMGAEYARRLAAEHYDLIITGRRKEQIEKLAEDLRKQYGVGVNVVIA
jgi:short-subunit dehydrogenase